jgi:hypothetical protein
MRGISTLTEERTRSSDHFESRSYTRQVFVNILTPIGGALAVSYCTLQYSQPVCAECKVESNSSETIAIRAPACIGNKNMNFPDKGNPSWNIYLTQTVKKEMKFWFPNVTSALTHFSTATIDISNVFCGEVIGMTRNRRMRKRIQ